MYEEGDIADGPNGELIFKGGRWVPVATAPTGVVVPPNPARMAQQMREQTRQDEADRRAADAQARADRAEQRAAEAHDAPTKGYIDNGDGTWSPVPGGPADTARGGKAMRQGDADKLESQINAYSYLKDSVAGFQDDFAGNTWTGELENWAQGRLGTGTPGQREWWSNFRTADNLIRNELFGASLTEGEKAAYAQTTVEPSMSPETVRANIKRRAEIAKEVLSRRVARIHQTFNKDEVEAALGEFAPELLPKTVAGANGGTTKTVSDDEARDKIIAMLRSGADSDEILAWAQGAGLNPRGGTRKAIEAARKNPGGARVTVTREAPLTLRERVSGSAPAAAVANMADAFSLGTVGALAGRDNLDAMSAAHPNAAAAGDAAGLAGQIVSGYGAGQAIPGLARFAGTGWGASALGAGVGGYEGAMTSDGTPGILSDGSALGDGLAGAMLGATGGLVGAKVIAPLADRAMRTQGGQLISGAVRGAVNRIRPGSLAPQPTVPAFATGERALPDFTRDEFAGPINSIRDAAEYNLPYSLADADPRLRMLAGSVTRKSPDARELAERTFGIRARGQADRAWDAVNEQLAPVTNIAERGAQWRKAAQTASAPYYAAGMARAAPVDERVAVLLQTPAGKRAVKQAYEIAGNEGRDPRAMGFDLDEQGEVIIRNLPSYETLDLVKRGIDAELAPFRNPFTGKLDAEGNPAAGAIEGFRQRFVSTLDELNPDYKLARGAYQGEIQNRTALESGQAAFAPQVKARDLPGVTGGFDERQAGEFQRGFATSMADRIDNSRLTANPYDAVFGTTAQQEKVGQVFPGAPRFSRIYDLERDMAKTATETLGGSPTASRLAADQMFDSPVANAADIGTQLITGGGVSPIAIGRLAGPKIADHWRMGMGRKKADALAPVLFSDSPTAVLDYINELGQRQLQDQMRAEAFRRRGALVGALAPPVIFGGGGQ